MKKRCVGGAFRLFAILSALIQLFVCLPAFAEEPVRAAALKGPTGMAFAHMMAENDGDTAFILAGAPDELTGQLIAGKIDIAAVPTNLACVLYNKTKGGVRALSVITGGMLYVLERGDSVHTVKDLQGKRLLSAGQGAAPQYIFSFILEENGVTADVTYSAEQSEVVSLAAAGREDLVVLPEPHVTTLLAKDPSFRIALSLSDLFEEAAGKAGYADAGLYMSTVIVRSEFLEAHPEQVELFMEKLEASIGFALTQPEDAAREIAQAGIIPSEAVALKALPSCALTFLTGDEMRARLSPMLQVLFDGDPAAVGGKLPEADFFVIPAGK